MMEEAAEDCIAWENATGAHRFIDTTSHLKHAITVARINDQVEYLGVWQADTLRLELADDL